MWIVKRIKGTLQLMFRTHPRITSIVLGVLLLLIFSSGAVRMGAVQALLTVTGMQPPQDEYGHTNLLLLGVGDPEHAGADLTDMMMLASVEPASRSVSLISIPRDLYLTGNKTVMDGRVNTLLSAYHQVIGARNKKMSDAEVSQAAMRAVADAMSERLDVPIHGVIKVDFTALVAAIDAIGGIDIVVPKTIVDYAYPLREGVTGTFKITAGPRHLDGETALKYARTRHSGTDFDRSARQQQVLQALTQKVKSMGYIEQAIFGLSFLKKVQGHIETTLQTKYLIGLTQIAAHLSTARMIRAQVDYAFLGSADPTLYNGAAVLIPMSSVGDVTGWKQIRLFVSLLVYYRGIYLWPSDVHVIDTAKRGYHTVSLQEELKKYKFDLVVPRRSKTVVPPVETSRILYTHIRDLATAERLSALTDLPAHYSVLTPETGTGSVQIILGKDYTFRPFVTRVK